MRKVTTRTVVVMLLATMSLSSYVFLNTVTPKSSTPANDKVESEANELKALENVDIMLPDVMLLKKIYEVGKRIVPAS
ncbi:MAG: hypothetical protein ACK4TA_03870 [Saprospiraceae bacterium]